MLVIKLKNSKQKNLFAAVMFILVVSLGFMSLYGMFGRQAEEYQSTRGQDESGFLENVFRSNYVLYKQVKEKSLQQKISYADLYLEIKELSDEEKTGYSRNYDDILANAETIQDWESTMFESFLQSLDYCAIDNETGEIIKNTGRSPEELVNHDENWENPYAFYVKMSYDNIGNVQDISVKSKEADRFLKSVQAYAQRFDQNMAEEKHYIKETEESTTEITVQTKRPANVTFIYAATEEQKQLISGVSENVVDFYSYYNSSIPEAFLLSLLIIAIIALLLPKMGKHYILHQCRWCRLAPELLVIIASIIMACNELIVDLVHYSNQDILFQQLSKSFLFQGQLSSETDAFYLVIKFCMNLICLFTIFGIWFWCITSFGGIQEHGFKAYIKERSFLYRFWNHTKEFWKGLWKKFKKEILSVDLSKDTNKMVCKVIIINFIILFFVCCFWFMGIGVLVIYSIILYLLIRKYLNRIQNQYKELLKVTNSIAQGNLNTALENDLGVFESYKAELAKIQEGFKAAVEEEVKSQKLKTELITNVSHDLKTPLTAIITYIDLLKEENLTEEQRREYIATLEKKSLRLKVLIEDLFEVSKAESKNVTINLVPVDIGSLLKQVYLEHEDQCTENGLNFRFQLPEEKVILNLDSQKTYRVFENLYVNISKYAMQNTRVYVNAEKTENGILIEMKNISANELNINPDELTDRFVRGDFSRNTEGSGLGLAIAKSFVELQGGKMAVGIDGDLFKVKIEF